MIPWCGFCRMLSMHGSTSVWFVVSYGDLERRVPKDHPLRAIRRSSMWRCPREWRVRGDVRASGPALDRTGKAAASPATSGFYTVRSERQLMQRLGSICCSAGLSGSVSTIGSGTILCSRRTGASFGGGDCCPVPHVPSRSGRDPEASVRRALLGRWNTGGGLGEPEELQAQEGQGWRRASGIIGTQRRGRLPRREASNQTHASTTDPDARLYRKGSGMEAKLSFIGHALMENRNGLFVAARLTNVSGHAETDRARYDRALCRHSRLRSRWAAIRASMPLTSSWSFAKSTDAARRPKHDPPVRHRPAHDASSGLRHQPACSKTDRRGLRMDEDNRRNAETQIPKPRKGRLVIHFCSRRLQPDPPAKAHGPTGMSATRTPIPIPIAPLAR